MKGENRNNTNTEVTSIVDNIRENILRWLGFKEGKNRDSKINMKEIYVEEKMGREDQKIFGGCSKEWY